MVTSSPTLPTGGAGTRNRTSANATEPNRRSVRSSRSSSALSSPSVRTPAARRVLIVPDRSGRSSTRVSSGCRAVQPRPVTSASALTSSPPTRQHPQGPALLEGLQRPQRVVQVRGHLGEGAGIGRLPHLDQSELPFERPPGEEETGPDGQEPVVHRPPASRA